MFDRSQKVLGLDNVLGSIFWNKHTKKVKQHVIKKKNIVYPTIRSRHPEAPGSFERVRHTDPSNYEFKLESGKSCDGAKLIFIAQQPT